ncbi:unnamed protein product, partial [marine sediment metagenome]
MRAAPSVPIGIRSFFTRVSVVTLLASGLVGACLTGCSSNEIERDTMPRVDSKPAPP